MKIKLTKEQLKTIQGGETHPKSLYVTTVDAVFGGDWEKATAWVDSKFGGDWERAFSG